jgi:hypothetical protein
MDAGATPTPTTPDTTSPIAGGTLLGQKSPSPQPDQGQPPPADQPKPGEQAPQGDQPNEPPEQGEPEGGQAPDESAYAGLTVGEGLLADEAALADFKKLAAANRIAPEAAQQILDMHGRMQAAAMQQWQATVQDWRRQAEADPYLSGGDIPNGGFRSSKEAVAAAGRFLNQYGDSELRQALDQYGLGNHPALVRALAKAGRDLAPDTLHAGRPAPRANPLRAMYPTMGDEYFPN